MKNILLIAGTRPNFVKLAPLYHRLKSETNFSLAVCHTGQHFDKNMSDSFFECLELPSPDFSLNVRGNSVPDTIGKTIVSITEVLQTRKFDLVIVFGDVNATVAGAVAAVQSGIKVMHVEAGLRSYDKRMPEEINRVLTDSIADFLLVSEQSGLQNLEKEGVSEERVFHVGNIMIETLIRTMPKWKEVTLTPPVEQLKKEAFALATFHRPENVDDREKLQKVVELLKEVASHVPLAFPVHPRTRQRLKETGLLTELERVSNIHLMEPLGYFEFLNLVSHADFIMTDSGGIQEETTYLNIPCLTFRNNTERPATIASGTNLLLNILDKFTFNELLVKMKRIREDERDPIPFWDENVSERITKIIKNSMS